MGMIAGERGPLRVAVLADSKSRRAVLERLLEQQGFRIVLMAGLGESTLVAGLDRNQADMLLVDLDERTVQKADFLLALIEQSPLPVLFNDGSTAGGQADLGPRLARKFRALGSRRTFAPVTSAPPMSASAVDVERPAPEGASVEANRPLPVTPPSVFTNAPSDHGPAPESSLPPLAGAAPAQPGAAELKTPVSETAAPESATSAVGDTAEGAPAEGLHQTPELDLEPESEPEPATEPEPELELELELEPEPEPGSGLASKPPLRSEPEQAAEVVRAPVPGERPTDAGIDLQPADPERARRVWVLGASLGGPQAVRLFLSGLVGDLPIAFILAQHIGEGFDALLASQLDRETRFRVGCANAGHCLRHGDVLLAPLNSVMRINRQGLVELQPLVERGIYSPSIDAVMSEVARRYGANSGAIVFSGMGDDGIEGAQAIAEQGGVVWAQDADSAVISSMPDHARRSGVVSLSGPPDSLAGQLVKYLATPSASVAR
ncbi:MAG: hypothetical protein B7Z66_10430 [Chromatiales bacterium 21-64-14]|nr:MAG: hypothetical protein B7Z66_10430 [Chromatiales bacterium 21-64-14]